MFDDEGNFRIKQVIDYKKIIGKSYVNGKYIETKLGKVHYSKTGFHVVPYIKKVIKYEFTVIHRQISQINAY